MANEPEDDEPLKRTYLVDKRHLSGVRFSHQFLRRLDTVRKFREQTRQTYIHNAVSRAIDADEAILAARASVKPDRKVARTAQGLGVREKLDTALSRFEREETRVPAVSTAPPVSVHVQIPAIASSGGADVTTLAQMVVDGPRFDRKRLLESACRMLAKSASTPEERIHLAERLDEEIKRIEGAPKSVLERVRERIKGKR